jgi:hypothetical protein
MNWSYLIKHWIGTIFISPFVFELFCIFNRNLKSVIGLVEVYPITIIFSLIFSTPTHVLYGFLYYFLGKKNINLKFSKLILILFYALGIIISFALIFGIDEVELISAYLSTSIFIGLVFKLKR